MNNELADYITIYTDGGCIGNPGPGGYAALIISDGLEHVITGGEPSSTNNRCELLAVIKGLEAIPAGASATLHSDSKYVVQGMTQWMDNWKRKGWRTYDKKPVKNKDLWLQLDALNAERSITYYWVKGHAGHEFNERVDALANAEAERASSQTN